MKLTSEYFETVGIKVWQPSKGYRYGADSLMLARYCEKKVYGDVLELGAGCGIISLVLASLKNVMHVHAVEIQKALYDVCMRNIEVNDMNERVSCINMDYRDFSKQYRKKFDFVVSNPPFFKVGSGRISPYEQRAMAKHELFGGISDLVLSMAVLLRDTGRSFIIFPSDRDGDLMDAVKANGLARVSSFGTHGNLLISEFKLSK